MESLYLVGLAVLAVFAFVIVIVVSKYFMTWLRARIANAPVGIGKMIGMSLRKVPVGLIVDNRITAVKAGPGCSERSARSALSGGRRR